MCGRHSPTVMLYSSSTATLFRLCSCRPFRQREPMPMAGGLVVSRRLESVAVNPARDRARTNEPPYLCNYLVAGFAVPCRTFLFTLTPAFVPRISDAGIRIRHSFADGINGFIDCLPDPLSPSPLSISSQFSSSTESTSGSAASCHGNLLLLPFFLYLTAQLVNFPQLPK